ncbi:MAG: pyruvate formate lyase-activating protein [Ruminococcaceae bacterium]|nr:pyruvate formate lyase-activating protein [Oscillospiraceae bacterium]
MTGLVNSIQSLAAVDGPGVRFAVFMQGCHLRCGYCHNPDTWDIYDGTEYTAEEIADRCERYREYFGNDGGITVSGGEPLLQAEFVGEVFRLCRERGINTCLDTSGAVPIDDAVKRTLSFTDRVLLDIKFANDEMYMIHTGSSGELPLGFLEYLSLKDIPTTLRRVIVSGLTDDVDGIGELRRIADSHRCVDKIELLPFRKMCSVKYEKMGMKFPFEIYDEPSLSDMERLNCILSD